MNIINKNLDFHLIKFPIVFPLVYCSLIYGFPEIEIYVIFFTLLFLAEPHFGATWPFLLHKENIKYILQRKFLYFANPFFIIIFCLSGYFLFNTLFLLLFFLANVFHVTRQSIGISKLYLKNSNEKNFQINTIYIFNIIFAFIGIWRFYLQPFTYDQLILLNILFILITSIIIFFYIYRFNISQNFFILLSGIIIFYPICFVNNPIHAIIMGVTMHYIQYLALTSKITFRRKQSNGNEFFSLKKFMLFIIIYSILMSVLSLTNRSNTDIIKYLLIIPITGQTLHFYFDSLLWKFSEKHNRNNVLKYVFN